MGDSRFGHVTVQSLRGSGRWLWRLGMETCLAGLTLGIRLGTGPLPLDDAFITFHYAWNLAEGFGLVFNPGQLVLGTTAPLYAICWEDWDAPWAPI